MKRLDGSTPNDVQAAIASNDPKDKVLEFKILKANAEGLERNDEEHKGIVKKLEAAKGFPVSNHLSYRKGTWNDEDWGEDRNSEVGKQSSHFEGRQGAYGNGN
jgi:hypothetical protein